MRLVSFLVENCGAACYNGHEVIIMEKIEHIGIYACPFGFFRIVEEEGAVVAIDVVKERQGEEAPSEVTDLAARELAEYLAGERQVFTFPYRLVGTPFRLKVWHELEKVPYGETTTYKKLAEAIGRQMAYELPTLIEATLLNAEEGLRTGITATMEAALRDFIARRKQLQLPLDEPGSE